MRKAMLFAALVFTSGQSFATDYSPYPELSIKTVGTKIDKSGFIDVTVAITNNTQKPWNANFECSLFDKDGTPYSIVQGASNAIPPAQTVAAKALGREKTKPVTTGCRIVLLIPTN
jgi:hypothetical protein